MAEGDTPPSFATAALERDRVERKTLAADTRQAMALTDVLARHDRGEHPDPIGVEQLSDFDRRGFEDAVQIQGGANFGNDGK